MSVSTGLDVSVPGRLEEVADGVFAYVQPDGSWMINNTGFLVARDGVTAVDACSTERRTRAFLDTVANVTRLPVRTLVNTHHHPDHTAGNGLFSGATIVAHDNAREEMRALGVPRNTGTWTDVDYGDLRLAPALPDVRRPADALGRRAALRAAVRRPARAYHQRHRGLDPGALGAVRRRPGVQRRHSLPAVRFRARGHRRAGDSS